MSSIVQPQIISIEKLRGLERLAGKVEADSHVGQADVRDIQNLHQELKNLKHGIITISYPKKVRSGATKQHLLKVSWDEKLSMFNRPLNPLQAAMGQGVSKQNSSQDSLAAAADVGRKVNQEAMEQEGTILDSSAPSPRSETLPVSHSESVPMKIFEELNNIENVDRVGRRADHYSLGQQSTNNLSSRVLDTAKRDHNPTLHVAYSDAIMDLSRNNPPTQISTSSANSDAMEITSPDRDSLVAKSSGGLFSPEVGKVATIASHGKNDSFKDQPILIYGFDNERSQMKKNLIEKFRFRYLQTMNDYNACIGIGLSLEFSGYCKFFDDVQNGFAIDTSRHPRLTEDQVQKWANCLKQNEKQFDFSGRLNTDAERISFLLKNGTDHKNTNPNEMGFLLSKLFREKKWVDIVAYLKPAFDLLNKVRELRRDQIERAYNKLDPYQKKMLDEMVTWAFLRKTSKLGMIFAKANNMPVLFAWKIPKTSYGLNHLRAILEVKPYNDQVAVARELQDTRHITREAITLSEMREIGRLQQKMMAPDYLLIVDISEDAGTQEISSSGAATAGISKNLVGSI